MHDGVKAMRRWQTFLLKSKKIPVGFLWVGSILSLLLALLWSLCVGVVSYSPAELFTFPDILRYVRFPRVFAAIFAGAGLAGAGVIIQTILGNPLAGPNIIGVNSSAAFLTVVTVLVFPLIPALQPLAAFLGALISVLLVYGLSRRVGTSKMTLLLAGVILNSLMNAASEALCTFFPEMLMSYSSFRVGGLSSVQPSVLWPAAGLITGIIFLVQRNANTLELLALGDETAFSLGIVVGRNRLLFLIGAAGLAGAAVSFAGLIGFLGLIVPHANRFFVGDEIKKLFPLSALWGGTFLLCCDTIARTAFAPFELSVGIVLSVVGAPIFIRMLLSRKMR